VLGEECGCRMFARLKKKIELFPVAEKQIAEFGRRRFWKHQNSPLKIELIELRVVKRHHLEIFLFSENLQSRAFSLSTGFSYNSFHR
jgi:hypothetical protein